jgi:uncharacterized protein YnzC (UPF0291/DUF896 family)
LIKGTETKNTEGAIWTRIIGPKRTALSAEAARSILELSFPERDKLRMNELAAKARAGKLSTEEEEEVRNYSRVGSVLGILKSKARVSLSKRRRSDGKGR